MNQYQLARLSERAARMAYVTRKEEERRADSELLARAWERLEDAAFALEAMYARRASFSTARIPPSNEGPSEDQRPQLHG